MVWELLASTLADHGDFSVPSTRTEGAKALAVKILAAVDSESGEKALHAFSCKMMTRLNGIVESSSSRAKFSSRKEKMWRDFHAIRSTDMKKMWCKFIGDVGVEESDLLLMQYVFDIAFDEVVKSHFSSRSSTQF